MKIIGSRERHLIREDGSRIILILRRFRCEHCHKIHHELPDEAVPRKQYSAAAIEEALRKDGGHFPGEASTAYRLCGWFALLRGYFEANLKALTILYKEDIQLLQELLSLIPLNPPELAAGWLKHLVRLLVNSGRWQHTRFA